MCSTYLYLIFSSFNTIIYINSKIYTPQSQVFMVYREERLYMKKPLKVEDLAELLDVSSAVIYDMVRRNEIPYFKVGRRLIRFQPSAIEKWMNEQDTTIINPSNNNSSEVLL